MILALSISLRGMSLDILALYQNVSKHYEMSRQRLSENT